MVDRKKIASVMSKRGLRVSDVSRLSGLSTGHICDILSGRRRRLQATTVLRLARALGVEAEDLIVDTHAREEHDVDAH